MTPFEALILGLVQGLTEFLPVSSSGHLALTNHLLGVDTPGLGFEVWLHLATLAAVVAAMRKDLLRLLLVFKPSAPEAFQSRQMVAGILLGTVPAIVVGLSAKDLVERAFGDPQLVGVGLVLTACILAATRFLRRRNLALTLPRAFLVGCGQALAIFPGISRSGSTLAMGLATGLDGHQAARFSFLLSMPAILGASVFELGSMVELGNESPLVLVTGAVSAAVSGYVAIRIVWRVMESGKLWMFSPYCLAVGLLALFVI